MKSDIDRLMQERNIDVLLARGPAFHNPPVVYLTGGGHMLQADVIQVRGRAPVLFCNAMERDEAARTGLATRGYDEYPLIELIQQAGGDRARALALRYQKMLTSLGVERGRVAICGKADSGEVWAVFNALRELLPAVEFVGEVYDTLLLAAMETKGPEEIERIRRMGDITVGVVGQTADFLSSHRARGDVLVHADGEPLTIGDVRRNINRWLVERGAENPEGTIFAIGRDAGFPHSTGNDADPLRLGQTIVYDIFPCEPMGGYFYDFTRTWCLGYAPDEAQALHEQVLRVHDQMAAELRPGAFAREFQQRTCELFEAQGHPTQLSDPKTESGYVHGLGHGVGLNIHEQPFLGFTTDPEARLKADVVVTIEPGLYYPERGLGVRIEDTYWVRGDGPAEALADFPTDLVLPVRK